MDATAAVAQSTSADAPRVEAAAPERAAPVVSAPSTAAAASQAAVTTLQPPATAAAPAATHAVSFPVRPVTTAHVAKPATAPAPVDAGSIGGAVFSLLLVIGLIFALGWLAKRMPGMQRGAGNARLKVVASIALGPRDRAVVLDVGGQQLLVGVGPGGVRTLHTLEHPLPVAEATAPSPFAQVLAQHFGKKS